MAVMKTPHMIIATLLHCTWQCNSLIFYYHLCLSSCFVFHRYIPAAVLLFVLVLALIAKFQPYKHKRNNTIDTILLLAVINVHKLWPHLCSYYAGGFISKMNL